MGRTFRAASMCLYSPNKILLGAGSVGPAGEALEPQLRVPRLRIFTMNFFPPELDFQVYLALRGLLHQIVFMHALAKQEATVLATVFSLRRAWAPEVTIPTLDLVNRERRFIHPAARKNCVARKNAAQSSASLEKQGLHTNQTFFNGAIVEENI